MNGIVDAYEYYFSNITTFHFDFNKRKNHNCLVCTGQLLDDTYQIFSREKTEKFIINYLEHLKVFGFSKKKLFFHSFLTKLFYLVKLQTVLQVMMFLRIMIN